MKLLEGLN